MRLVVGVLVSVAICPAAAQAGTVRVEQPLFTSFIQLTFEGYPGEANDVVTSNTGATITVEDAANPLDPGDRCVALTPNRVECDATGASQQWFSLGDGDDRLRLGSLPPIVSGAENAISGSVDGGPGNDDIAAPVGGDEFFNGGTGNDVIDAGAGDDDVLGGEFADNGPDRDVLDGGPGDDYLEGYGDDDVLRAGDGDDSVVGDDGDDRLEGGPGQDRITGGRGEDAMLGGEGNDRIEARLDLLTEGGHTGHDVLDGEGGDDLLGAGPDPGSGVFVVDQGGAVANPAPDPDVMRGGPGRDTVEYGLRSTPLSISLDGVANDGAEGEHDDVAADVETLIGGAAEDTLTGGAGGESLNGAGGDDLLRGLGGDDELDGGVGDAGSDSLEGGEGADTLRGQSGDDSLDGGPGDDTVAGGGGSDGLAGGDGGDTLAGGAGIDRLTGGDGDDTLRGGDLGLVGADGADDLDGGGGADALEGGPGNDRLDGGEGADRISGGEGRDTADYGLRAAAVTVTLDDVANDGEAGEGDGIGRDVESVVGSAAPDTITGDNQASTLDGGSGEDVIDGGAGTDQLAGGTGADVLRSRDGVRDTVSCGQESDLAIVDLKDVVRDCELVDRGRRRRARLGRDVLVAPARGANTFRLPESARFVPLRERLALPVGADVDSSAGTVTLTTAKAGGGAAQAEFYGGSFTVGQSRRDPETEVRLTGGDFRRCPKRGARRAAAAALPVRHLWGRVSKMRKGRFRARGRYSAAGVRGTVWLVQDRCDGTLTRVISGRVVVEDLVRHKRVVLRAGQRYLARAPR
jgi:Ca2+-binding RTX toxin-like protein